MHEIDLQPKVMQAIVEVNGGHTKYMSSGAASDSGDFHLTPPKKSRFLDTAVKLSLMFNAFIKKLILWMI